jgi:demethylmenaquinone methyltransferase / 2-methoxy-6-polyprenyl-1,4-benzoquinol methylase
LSRRKPGLQDKWTHVVTSLEAIVSSYEEASSRISIYADKRMRAEAVAFVVRRGDTVLDVGAGPGTMSRTVTKLGGNPVLLDASRVMLKASGFTNAVQGVFEQMPFREAVFDGAVSGFAIRDARDLPVALEQLDMVLKPGGRFGLCDLGKSDNSLEALVVAVYLRIVPTIIGLATTGRAGAGYGSLYDTYNLVLHNADLLTLISRLLGEASIHQTQFGASIVIKCTKGA